MQSLLGKTPEVKESKVKNLRIKEKAWSKIADFLNAERQ